jgi:vancomycin resistance protein YoaR
MFRYRTELFEQMLDTFSSSLDINPQDALFQFSNGRVTEFKPSVDGRRVNIQKARKDFLELLALLPARPIQKTITVTIPVENVKATVTTDSVNTLGIRERIGTGYSEFTGSIAGRIHNVALAANRFNGVLIPPGATLSFNETLGDVSAATGYQQAYIIKDGRTILGDGGGVCQVSTTLFRAALNAGLPVIERTPHAYRVHYYEEGGYKPGIDATVFSPSVDLKIQNDTQHHILIQARIDTRKLTLAFDLYGTADGRVSEVYNHKVWSVTPPPEPLYQDDPTLPAGTVKQVDWAAWGAKASFDYKVTRNGETILEKSFFSNYRPWQAVYLRGTQGS